MVAYGMAATLAPPARGASCWTTPARHLCPAVAGGLPGHLLADTVAMDMAVVRGPHAVSGAGSASLVFAASWAGMTGVLSPPLTLAA